MNQEALDPPGLFPLDGMEGVHVELKLVRAPFLEEENDRGNDDGDDGDRRGKVVVRAGFAEILVIDDDGEGLIAAADEQRRSVIGEGPHEDQQRRRQNRRHAQGDDHLEEAADAPHAHVLGGLQEAVVDILQGAGNQHEHQREELQAQHRYDAPEAVDGRGAHAGQLLDELGDDAVVPPQLHPGVGADEGRRHAAEDDDDLDQVFALDFIHVIEIGQGHAQNQGNDGRGDGQEKGIQKGLAVIGLGEELAKVIQGEIPVLGDGLNQQPYQRIEQKQPVEPENHQGQNHPYVPFFLCGCFHAHPSTRSFWTPSRMFREPSSVSTLIFSALTVMRMSMPLGRMLSILDS